MEKTQIKISDILTLLEQGKTRVEIRQTLGLTHKDMSEFFKHPKLKNKRPKSNSNFELVDDTEENEVEETPVQSEYTSTDEVSTDPIPEETSDAPVVEEKEGIF